MKVVLNLAIVIRIKTILFLSLFEVASWTRNWGNRDQSTASQTLCSYLRFLKSHWIELNLMCLKAVKVSKHVKLLTYWFFFGQCKQISGCQHCCRTSSFSLIRETLQGLWLLPESRRLPMVLCMIVGSWRKSFDWKRVRQNKWQLPDSSSYFYQQYGLHWWCCLSLHLW